VLTGTTGVVLVYRTSFGRRALGRRTNRSFPAEHRRLKTKNPAQFTPGLCISNWFSAQRRDMNRRRTHQSMSATEANSSNAAAT
jgi:hypothetical protein